MSTNDDMFRYSEENNTIVKWTWISLQIYYQDRQWNVNVIWRVVSSREGNTETHGYIAGCGRWGQYSWSREFALGEAESKGECGQNCQRH